ncbi:NADPH-dependent 7-cyano-7-deazaguanine reductase QueF [Halioxenophilus sp. WMMB6]|uniref:NADPH-dependent 7-cyano-7-deazaguanine reductase QueF n=1 Tax=Halioxenophilus sp. WMMB6 TaxID=3073815 RepID=UPI00295EDCAE|nr:NADPH-dependent 7-cyano-7-deazaguanine reductase QueF [Halioxenophilus sp. WMMB6]
MAVDHHTPAGSGLGKETEYASLYDARLLYPIPRATARQSLGIGEPLPFYGVDLWTAWELSWLNSQGLPQVAVAELAVPIDSANIVESKSLKLYCNSFNQTQFADWSSVAATMEKDLTQATGAPVAVRLMTLTEAEEYYQKGRFEGAFCLDELPVTIEHYHPEPALLRLDSARAEVVSESLVSHLLKTNCPVTGQPDWASLWLSYTGPAIDRESLLAFIVSFREHQDFHEQCVERFFLEIRDRLRPTELSVYARYTRRGGLDINPYRSSDNTRPAPLRLVRQ